MVIRIETAGITRGREFKLYAYSPQVPALNLYAFNPVTKEVVQLDYEHTRKGDYHIFSSNAPHFDGYLLAKIGNQRLIKKIGYPLTTFVYGYLPNYTIVYKFFDIEANIIKEGNLKPIIDGFYYEILDDSVMMVEVRGKKILINKNISKLNYKVTMTGGELNSNFESVPLENIALPEVKLPSVELKGAVLNSTMPEVTIEEL